jgi:hypothetical protein
MNPIQQLTVQGFPVRTTGANVPKSVQALQTLIVWRNRHDDSPDYWLRAVICRAFERMIPRRMQDTPAADLIEFVAEDWIDIIGEGMEQDLDLDRVIAGFRLIFRECNRWPQPADLLKRLPRRSKPTPDSRTMETPISDEEHARQKAELQKIIDSLK